MSEAPNHPGEHPNVTQLLRDWQQGDASAGSNLAAVLYVELKRLAAARIRGEREGHTLQPTALVHEAWMKLSDAESDWQSRAHFFGLAAMTMRRILVDHARRREAAKRGDGAERVPLDDVAGSIANPLSDTRLLALDEALTRLAELDPRQARVVELRYFAGLTVEETATILGVSAITVKREWATARAWLFDAVEGGEK